MDSITGTYCGVLPPDVETTLTLHADGTYLLVRTFKDMQNEQEQLKGTFQMLDDNILMLLGTSPTMMKLNAEFNLQMQQNSD